MGTSCKGFSVICACLAIVCLFQPENAFADFTGFITHKNIINRSDSASRPGLLVNFIDNDFGVTLKRITNASTNYGGLGDTTFVRHEYSKIQSWNSDGSYVVMFGNNGDWFLFNGTTYSYIKPLSSVPGVIGEGPRWHPTDPDLFYYCSGNKFYRYKVSTDTSTLLRTFTGYTYITIGNAEGSLSIDGKYVALLGADASWARTGMWVYNITDNTVGTTMSLSQSGQTPDSITISPLGNFVLVVWNNVSGHNRYYGSEVFDRNFNYLRKAYYGVDHGDVGLDTNGDEIYVVDGASDPDTGSNHYIQKINLATGAKTNLLELSWYLGVHVSMRHANRGTSTPAGLGYAVISTYSTSYDATHSYPYENEILAIKLDGSTDVQRIVHHRSAPEYAGGSTRDYYAEPHVSLNRDGSKLVWASSWRYTNPTNDSSIKEDFLIDMPSGGADVVPPVRSNGLPAGTLSAGTTSTTISLVTNESATCKYGTASGVAYGSILNTFGTTGGTSHSQFITGLTDGGSYTYFVRCNDLSGNFNVDDFSISFSVALAGTPKTPKPPVIKGVQ